MLLGMETTLRFFKNCLVMIFKKLIISQSGSGFKNTITIMIAI
jgi:hypothetical protein